MGDTDRCSWQRRTSYSDGRDNYRSRYSRRHSDRFGCKRCTPDTSFRTNGAGRKHKTAETRFPSVKLFSLLEQAA